MVWINPYAQTSALVIINVVFIGLALIGFFLFKRKQLKHKSELKKFGTAMALFLFFYNFLYFSQNWIVLAALIGISSLFWAKYYWKGKKKYGFGIWIALNAIIIAVLFLNAQDVLFGKQAWDSPMLFALPFAGFWMVFLLMDWISDYYEHDFNAGFSLPILIWVFAWISYLIIVWFFVGNMVSLNGKQLIVYCFSSPPGLSANMVPMDGCREFINQPFLIFVFGAIAGWLSKMIHHAACSRQLSI